MLFDSTAFIVFLILVTLIYWRMAWRAQNYFLLAASYVFYAWWDWRFSLLMAGSTVADYLVSRRIASTSAVRTRQRWLFFSIALNLSFLGVFKYFNFFIDSAVDVAALLGLKQIPVGVWQILLPPGISFYTFQEVAYIVDVYHRRVEAARS